MKDTFLRVPFSSQLAVGFAAILLPLSLCAQTPPPNGQPNKTKPAYATASAEKPHPDGKPRPEDPMARLGLTKEQQDKLHKLRADADKDLKPLFDEQRQLMEAFDNAWQAPKLDKDALKELRRKMDKVQSKIEEKGFDMQLKVADILTSKQRQMMSDERRGHGPKPHRGDGPGHGPGKDAEHGPENGEPPPLPPFGPGMGMMMGICPPPPPRPSDKEKDSHAPPPPH